MKIDLDDPKFLEQLHELALKYDDFFETPFLSATNETRIDELFREKKDKVGNTTRIVIPIGYQDLLIKSITTKHPNSRKCKIEIECVYDKANTNKKLYMPIYLEYDIDYDNKNQVNDKGVPFDLIELRKFYQKAFGYEIQYYKDFFKMLEVQINQYLKKSFSCIMGEIKRLDRRGSKFITTVQYYQGQEHLVPKIIYEAYIVDYALKGDVSLFKSSPSVWDLLGKFSEEDKIDFSNSKYE